MGPKIAQAFLVATAISQIAAADTIGPAKYSPAQYLKNYALSTCIADGYSSAESKKDAAAAARGYLEFGSFPLEAHTEATLLGRKFLTREYKGMSGESLVLMKCIDFYHSKELNALVTRYQRAK